MSLYGKFDMTGVKDGDPDPCPRYWDEKRKTWSDDWKEQLFDVENQALKAVYETMNYRLRDKLPEPKTLLDICNEGIAKPDLATNAIAELLEQLYKPDRVKVLITIDNYN